MQSLHQQNHAFHYSEDPEYDAWLHLTISAGELLPCNQIPPPPVKVQLSSKYKQNMLQEKWNLEGRFEF